jgi:DNA-binding protein HU-beta
VRPARNAPGVVRGDLEGEILNKQQLIEWIQQDGSVGGTRAAAERALNCVLQGIQHGLKKDQSVALVGFGSFTVRKRKARMGRNPQTGEALKIKASKAVTFKAGQRLKDHVR